MSRVAAQSPRLVEVIDVGDRLGESVTWRATDQTLWWTDILGCRVHRLDWATRQLKSFPTPERLASFCFLDGNNDGVLGAFETGFAYFYPTSGEVRWLARPSELRPGRRLNDGRAGPDGSFWAGSMIEADAPRHRTATTGLYRVDASGRARFVRGGFEIANGICWSPDGSVMYMADSPTRTITKCAFDPRTGQIGAARTHARVNDGFPDGAITDRRGHLWSALWGAAKVSCFNPAGALNCELHVPALQPTCPAFCGPDLSLLAVSTATVDLTLAQLDRYPQSGSLLIYEGSFAGSPYSYYR